jgi:hypothetical protein
MAMPAPVAALETPPPSRPAVVPAARHGAASRSAGPGRVLGRLGRAGGVAPAGWVGWLGRARGAGRSAAAVAPASRVDRPGWEGWASRYRLRGRHVREHRLVRVGGALAAPDVALADDLLVLQVLRLRPLVDLDAAQVAALTALPPSVAASSLDRLVRGGLARDVLVGGRVRFGLP